MPQPPPADGLVSTKLVARSVSPESRIVTLDVLEFTGRMHQVGYSEYGRPITITPHYYHIDAHELDPVYDRKSRPSGT